MSKYSSWIRVVIILLLFPLFYIISLSNALLVHSLFELGTVLLGLGIFLVAIITNKVVEQNFINKLAPGIFGVSLLTIVHAVTYGNIGIISTIKDDNFSIQIFTIASLILPISLLIASRYKEKLKYFKLQVVIYTMISAFAVLIVALGWFPDCYREGTGVTQFKIIMNILTIVLYLSVIICIYYGKKYYGKVVYKLLIVFALLMIVSELLFLSYGNTQDLIIYAGHFIRLSAYGVLFYAVVLVSLKNPMFRLFQGIINERDEHKKNLDAAIINETLMRNIFNTVAEGIIGADLKGTILYINHRVTEILGYKEEELIHKNICMLADENDSDCIDILKSEFEGKKDKNVSGVFYDKNHNMVQVIYHVYPTTFDKAPGVAISFLDVSDKYLAEATNAANELRLAKTQELANVGSWELDIESGDIWASDQAFKIYGLPVAEDSLIPLKEVQQMVSDRDRSKMDKALLDLIRKNAKYDVEFEIIRTDGEKRILKSRAFLEFNKQNKPLKVIGSILDITESKNRENDLIYLNYHDYLTKLYNRRYLEIELKRLDSKRNLPISIIMGDVNGLKLINDSFGHHIGDELLVQVARILTKTLRDDEIIARTGGDEFVILLTNTSNEAVYDVITRINQNLKDEKVHNISMSISFGSATKEDIQENIEDVLKRAEDNMYRSKLIEAPSVRSNTINAMMNTLYEKDLMSEEHSNRVSEYAHKLAIALKLSPQVINNIKTAALLHDIGKITISNSILNKNGKLTDEEYEEIKKHPDVGFRILYSMGEMTDIAEFILYHHERVDGTGYPKGIKGDSIPIESRIITIADAYDAMTSTRKYRTIMSVEETIEELRRCEGTQFDPDFTEVFINSVLLHSKGE